MLRRIFFQVGVLAGGLAFLVTFWRALASGNFNILQASIRAVGAGIVLLVLALLISRFIEKLGGQA